MLSRPASGPIQIFAPDRGLVPGFSHRASRPSGTFAAEESSGGRPQGGGVLPEAPAGEPLPHAEHVSRRGQTTANSFGAKEPEAVHPSIPGLAP